MNRFTGSILKIILLTSMIAACGPSVGGSVTSQKTQPILVSNPCENIYFPVKTGATWVYQGTYNSSEPFSFSNTITEVRTDGFSLTTTFGNLNRKQEWSCGPEGLVALSFGDGPAGGVFTEGLDLEIQTSNISGLSIPVNLQPGSQWNYSMDLAGSMMLPDGQKGQGQGSMTTPMHAVSMEVVTVPAGTFEALRVETEPSIKLTVSYLGLPIPLTFSGKVTLWLAPGVGWIKSVESGEFFGTSIDSTIELQSLQIP